MPVSSTRDTAEVMRRWATVLTGWSATPWTAARELDWVAKQQVLEGYRDRDGLDWSDPRLRADRHPVVRRAAGEGAVPPAAGRGRMSSWSPRPRSKSAVHEPPEDTRAWFRGTLPRQVPDQIAAASWDSVIFDVPGQASLQRVPMLEPLRGTKAHVGALLDRSPDATTLLRELAAAAG